MTAPPVIGACLGVSDLARYRDWLFEKDRDLELQSFHRPEDLASGAWRDHVEEANRQLDGFRGRLGIHGPFRGLQLDQPDPDLRRLTTERFLTGLEVCAALGATQMVIHSPYKTWDHNNLDNQEDARTRRIEATHETLGPVVREAEARGVELVVENIEDVDPTERLRLAESFGSTAIRLSIDTGHAHYAHSSTGAPPVDYFVKLAGDSLAHVHLQDADGYADRHWAIGQGTIRWPAVFAALGALNARPRLVLELRDRDEIPASMAYLEALGLGQ
jgi:sugar phosphate isomerase/epimerase